MINEKSQLKIGVVLNYINLILGNLIPIFYTPIMLRLLGQNEYGLYKLSSGITSYLSLMTLGMGTAITRYLCITSFLVASLEFKYEFISFCISAFNLSIVVAKLVKDAFSELVNIVESST